MYSIPIVTNYIITPSKNKREKIISMHSRFYLFLLFPLFNDKKKTTHFLRRGALAQQTIASSINNITVHLNRGTRTFLIILLLRSNKIFRRHAFKNNGTPTTRTVKGHFTCFVTTNVINVF